MKEKTILFQYNIDNYGNPTSTKIKEVAQVSPLKYTIQLEQIPDEQFGVTLLNEDNTSMFQVFNYDDVEKTENSYYVNYTNGLIYFNSNQGAEKKVVNYYGTGVELISCKRIFDGHYDANGNWIVEILQDIIDASREAIKLMKNVGDIATILQLLETKMAEGDAKLQELQNAIDEANDLTKVTGNEEIIINTSDWVDDGNGGYYAIVNHSCNTESVHVTFKRTLTKENMILGYTIIDNNSFKVFNHENVTTSCIISAMYYRATQTISDDIAQEVVQARLGEDKLGDTISLLKTDIDMLKNTFKTVLFEDIDETEYKKGDIIDTDFIIKKQSSNYSYLMRKLKREEYSTNSEKVNIVCRGDSLTYGYDVNSSDKRPSVEKPNDKGGIQTTTIASCTYPEALEYALKNFFDKDVTIENCGISGTTCEWSFGNYYKARKDSIEIIMLGTNDSKLASYPHNGDIQRYIDYYEQLIIRSTLWGNAIIMVQSPSNQYQRDLNVETYRVAVKKLAEKYNITLLDASEITNSFDYTHWSDQTHLTGKGYRYLGYAIANAIIVQDPNQPLLVQGGTSLATRPTEDSCIMLGGARYSMGTTGYTSYSFVDGAGTPSKGYCKLTENGQKITYTFKTVEENLVVLPTIFHGEGVSFKVTLDHGLQQPCMPLSSGVYKFASFDNNRPSEVIIRNSAGTTSQKNYYRSNVGLEDMLFINHKGWHSLTIELLDGDLLTGNKFCGVYGVDFMSFEDWRNVATYHKYDKLYTTPNFGDPTLAGTIITLDKKISDYDFLTFSCGFSGVESRIIDFKLSSTQVIRTSNLPDGDTILGVYFGELVVSKVDEYTIRVDVNRGLNFFCNNDGSFNRMAKMNDDALSEIRNIYGVKV